MKELKKIATAMKERMTWAKELSPDMSSEIIIAQVLTLLLKSGMQINRQNVSQLIDVMVPIKKDYYALLVVNEGGYWEIVTVSEQKETIDTLYAEKVGEIIIDSGTTIETKTENHIVFENGAEVWALAGKGSVCKSNSVYVIYGELDEFKIDSICCKRSDAENRMNEIIEEYAERGSKISFKDNRDFVFDNHDTYKLLNINTTNKGKI